MADYQDLADALIKRLEGCRLTGYRDSVGKATNGIGHTGPEVQVGVTITQEIADHNEIVDRSHAEVELGRCVRASMLTGLKAHQRAALISFVFNLGADPKWTIWKDLNAGNLADVPAQFRRFVHGLIDGKEQVIPGLEHRREAEIVFWNTADMEAAVAVTQTANAVPAPPSSVTRAIPTPPVPTPPKALAGASLTTKIVTVVGAVGTGAAKVNEIVSPHVDQSHVFATASTALVGVVICASVIALLIHGEQQQQAKL